MEFKYDFVYKDSSKETDTVQYTWNPSIKDWRDIIEVYLTISRKFNKNKYLMFKLQLWILEDYVSNIKVLRKLSQRQDEIKKEIENGKDESEFSSDNSFLEKKKSEIENLNRILKDVMDGVAWRTFSYNRAILYLFADKEPITSIHPDQGLIHSLMTFSEIFTHPKKTAILNDITSFLRVGDITVIHENDEIELIEIKGGKRKPIRKQNPRVRRQKKRMEELVEFLNTGEKESNNQIFKIKSSMLKQKNYLFMLKESIYKARKKGFDSILIGDFMIVGVIDDEKIKNDTQISKGLERMHRSIKDEWERRDDLIFPLDITSKLNNTKNIAPFSIFPFESDVCADILAKKLVIFGILNISKVIQKFEDAGWEVIDSLLNLTQEDLERIEREKLSEICFLKIRKNGLTIEVPQSLFDRIQFELLSPNVIIDIYESILEAGPESSPNGVGVLYNYLDEKNIWR